jgi:hypothetical protein
MKPSKPVGQALPPKSRIISTMAVCVSLTNGCDRPADRHGLVRLTSVGKPISHGGLRIEWSQRGIAKTVDAWHSTNSGVNGIGYRFETLERRDRLGSALFGNRGTAWTPAQSVAIVCSTTRAWSGRSGTTP